MAPWQSITAWCEAERAAIRAFEAKTATIHGQFMQFCGAKWPKNRRKTEIRPVGQEFAPTPPGPIRFLVILSPYVIISPSPKPENPKNPGV
jgi:hypothetical protein